MLRSKEFAQGYLEGHQKSTIEQVQQNEEVDNGFTSDVKKYTEVMDDEVIRGSV